MKYKKLSNGEITTIYPDDEFEESGCCDCGLVHNINYRIKNKKTLEVSNTRNERATGQMRRWMKVKKEGVFNGGSDEKI